MNITANGRTIRDVIKAEAKSLGLKMKTIKRVELKPGISGITLEFWGYVPANVYDASGTLLTEIRLADVII